MQIFEVDSTPVLNQNGSTSGNSATHDWPNTYGEIGIASTGLVSLTHFSLLSSSMIFSSCSFAA